MSDTESNSSGDAAQEGGFVTDVASDTRRRLVQVTAGAIVTAFVAVGTTIWSFARDLPQGQIDAAIIEALKDPERRAVVVSDVLPDGAIVPFDREDGCPSGTEWRDIGYDKSEFERFAGRMLVISGPDVSRANGQATVRRKRNDTGGAERVALTVPEMPTHNHSLTEAVQSVAHEPGRESNQGYGVGGLGHVISQNTSSTGFSEPHENMPPFIALHFCKKVS